LKATPPRFWLTSAPQRSISASSAPDRIAAIVPQETLPHGAPMTQGFAIRALAASFQSRSPVRTWSLIVTVFGVMALPDSRALKLADLQHWLGACGIEAGLVRTALSRLVAGGTLLRERDRKAALYRLSAAAEAEFRQAAQLIYGPLRPEPTGWLEMALIENGHTRKDARAALEAQGFVALAGGTMLRAEHCGRTLEGHEGVILMRAEAGAAIAARAAALWPLADLADGYAAVGRHADGLLAEAGQLTTGDRIIARILLVHEFRRVILRDPFLPPSLLPANWPGQAARERFDAALAALGRMGEAG
jgi:phenylacetic acid degradation operon negative regulatory protein